MSRGRRLGKRENKRSFAKTAGYVNPQNLGARYLMRGGQRKRWF